MTTFTDIIKLADLIKKFNDAKNTLQSVIQGCYKDEIRRIGNLSYEDTKRILIIGLHIEIANLKKELESNNIQIP